MEREPEINIFVPERDIIVFKKNEVFFIRYVVSNEIEKGY